MNLKSMKRFMPDVWLNDENINWFVTEFNGLFPDCYCYLTYFYDKLLPSRGNKCVYDYSEVEGWSRRMQPPVMRRKKLLFPLNWGNSHWTLCAVDLTKRKIYHFDGFYGTYVNTSKNILQYIKDDVRNKLGEDAFDQMCGNNDSDEDWLLPGNDQGVVPRQRDGHSCGVRVILSALMFLRGDKFAADSFRTEDMNDIRLLLAYCVHLRSTTDLDEGATPPPFPMELYRSYIDGSSSDADDDN